jgi:FeS assembly protein IscX
MSLNWESSFAIVLELRRIHPDVDLEKVSLNQLKEWVIAIPEFNDDPNLANDDILMSIFQDWFEESIHGK